MSNCGESKFIIETRNRGDDVRVLVGRGKHKLGKLVLNDETICWVPKAQDDDARRMTWVMTWEQFAEAMQSRNIEEVVRLSQCAYTSVSRAEARNVRPEANVEFPEVKARGSLGIRRYFNIAEFALIKKGYTPEHDDKWAMLFDSTQNELRLHRSSTGYCIYGLKFRENSGGAEICESWVNRDPEQYSRTNTEYDAEVANWLIDVFLLGRNREFPDESVSDEER